MQEISEISKSSWSSARRRLSYITPDNAQKVLRHDRYWTPELIQLYLERCDQLRLTQPVEAWKLVRWAAELVELIRVGLGRGELSSQAEKLSWQTRSLALEGEIAGLVGLPHRAEPAFAKALSLSRREKIQVVAGAELQRRRAAYALRQGQVDEARRLLDSAVAWFRRLDGSVGLAETLLLYGAVGDTTGLVALAEALVWAPPKGALERCVHDASAAMLMERLHEPRVSFEEYEAILGWLYLARKKWFARRTKSQRKLGLIWAEGRVLACLGLGRLAQRRLATVWQGMSSLGRFEAVAVSSLDLAAVLIGDDERHLARDVLDESRARIRRMSGDGELSRSVSSAAEMSLTELPAHRRETARRWIPAAVSHYPFTHPPSALAEDLEASS